VTIPVIAAIDVRGLQQKIDYDLGVAFRWHRLGPDEIAGSQERLAERVDHRLVSLLGIALGPAIWKRLSDRLGDLRRRRRGRLAAREHERGNYN
jgi:hypothetical protein